MKPFGEALRLGIVTTVFALLLPVLAKAQTAGETAKPDRSNEAESMLNGAPNQDATLRDKNAVPGAPVPGADPGMVKAPPKHKDGEMVAKPPQADMDPGIHAPSGSPLATPTVKK